MPSREDLHVPETVGEVAGESDVGDEDDEDDYEEGEEAGE